MFLVATRWDISILDGTERNDRPRRLRSVDADQWWEFEQRVEGWVCEHRAAAAFRDHRDDVGGYWDQLIGNAE